jgi:hypothetical protein
MALLEEDLPRDRDDLGFDDVSYIADDRLSKMSVDLIMFAYRVDRVDRVDRVVGNQPNPSLPFPGPNPISMDLEHLDMVRYNDYVCSPKVDGVRYQLVIVDGQVTLVDRTLKVLKPSFASLPETWFLASSDQPAFSTVLDAEMVKDRLMIFDVVMLAGYRTMDTKLDYRARMQLLEPCSSGMILEFGARSIAVVTKPIFEKHMSRALLDATFPTTSPFWSGVPLDGLVFTPVAEPVRTFTHWHMFKVKSHHTIDLRLVCIPRTSTSHMSPPLASPLPEAIARKIQPVILKNSITSIHVRKPASRSLVTMVGLKGTPAAAGQQQSLAAPVTWLTAPVTWLTRLEYTQGERSVDACTKGIDYSGRKIILKIAQDDENYAKLLSEIERAWRREEGDVVCMSLVVECQLDVEELASSASANHVTLVRTRPDKTEPNSYKTITRTMTSILYGVRPKQLEILHTKA